MRPKDQGTGLERWLLNRISQGLPSLMAVRLAEHGQNDAGDLAILLNGEEAIIVEAKRRQQLSAHAALAKAKAKAGKADLPWSVLCTIVVWDRPVLKEGNVRRSRVGEPVVIVGLNDFLGLL